MTLSQDDAFGLSEEKKRGFVLLSISDEGHPTFACPACWERVRVTKRGAALPPACPACKKTLKSPVIGNHVCRAHLVRGGHGNLIGDLADLPPNEKSVPAFRVKVRGLQEELCLAERAGRGGK